MSRPVRTYSSGKRRVGQTHPEFDDDRDVSWHGSDSGMDDGDPDYSAGFVRTPRRPAKHRGSTTMHDDDDDDAPSTIVVFLLLLFSSFLFFFFFFFFAQPPLFFPLQARPRKPGSNQPSAAGLRGRRNSARSSTSSSGLPSSSSSSSASSASSSSPSVASSAVPPGRRRSRLLHRTTMLTATLFSLFRQCQLAAASKAHAWCPPPPFPLQLGRRRLLPLTLPCSRHPLRAHPFASTDSVRLSARWFDAAAGWLSATTMAAPGRWWQRRQCVLVPPTMPLLLLLLLRPVTSHGEHGFGA